MSYNLSTLITCLFLGDEAESMKDSQIHTSHFHRIISLSLFKVIRQDMVI